MDGNITHIAVENLVRWQGNPRPKVQPEERESLKASIADKGVLLPLVVRPSGIDGEYEVIAGDTRRDIVQELQSEGTWPAGRGVPCIVRQDLVNDDAAALDVAISENLHVPMHPMDQFSAFYSLVQLGRTVTEIANAYGVKPRVVEQRLSYAKLNPKARDLVKSNERDLDWASAMTLASAEEQVEIMEEIEKEPKRYLTVHDVRRRMDDQLISIRHALFDPKKVDDKLVRRNLFDTEDPKFLPIAEFNRLQDEAVDALLNEKKNEGWKKVSVVNEREFDLYEYIDGVEDKDMAEVFIVRHASGAITVHEGLQERVEKRINAVDAAEDEDVGDAIFGQDIEEVKASIEKKPNLEDGKRTKAYLEKMRALVTQSIVMTDEKLALATQVATLVVEGAPRPLEGRSYSDILAIDVESFTRQIVEKRLDASMQHLSAAGINPIAPFNEVLEKLYAMDTETLFTIYQVEMARRINTNLAHSDVLYEAVLQVSGRTLSEVWRPDRTYLNTLSKPQLLAIAQQLFPDRIISKMRNQKVGDIAESFYQIVTDAFEGGMRLEHEFQEKVTAWAPALLGGAPISDSDFVDDNEEENEDVFADAENGVDESGEILFGNAA